MSALKSIFREDGRIRPEEDGGARALGGAQLLQLRGDYASAELDLPFGAVALHGDLHLGRQRVHHRRADAMQTTGGL